MKDNSAPEFKIFLNGSELDSGIAVDILSVTISLYVEGADMFTIEVNNWDAKRQEFKWIDSDRFDPGVETEIKIGYANNLKSLIKGEITAIEPEFDTDTAPKLKVMGFDRLHRFRRGKRTHTYIEMKDSEVADQIARKLKLKSEVIDTQVVHPYLLQNNQTDIDFLLERAKRIRYEVDIDNRTLIFRPAANDQGKSLTLTLGQDLQSFYPRLSTQTMVSEMIVQGWNPVTKETIVGQAGKGAEVSKMEGSAVGTVLTENAFGATQKKIVDKYLFSQAEADQIAKAKYNDMIVDFIKGEGTNIGDPDLQAGEVVEIAGLGQRFSGLYYLVSVTHLINSQGYQTQFFVNRNAV